MSNRFTLASIVGAGHAFFKQLALQLLITSSLFASNHQYLAHASNARVQEEGDRVTINVKNVALKEVFKMITRQTGMYFMGVDDETGLDRNQKVSLSVDNVPLDDVLRILLGRKGYSWVLNNNIILLRKKNDSISDKNNVPDTSSNKLIDLKGTVTNLTGEPLIGATVQVSQTKQATVADETGSFSIENVPAKATILISFVGYETKKVIAGDDSDIDVRLQPTVAEMNAISVVSTGYQKIPKERATGSFAQPDKTMFDARVATDVLSKLEGITSGVVFNSPGITGADKPQISIRGRSTIFANDQPLIVVDNFPYDGDINNINPNDVESITVLKDAAAASIWGVRAGNGVIVITTKRGKFNQPFRISLNANVTVQDKPDLYYNPKFINSSDLIDVQKFLYGKGFYSSKIDDPYRPVLSNVVEILEGERKGKITHQQAMNQIEALRSGDIRNDLNRYFYRKAVRQQYALSFSDGNERNAFSASVGYDKSLTDQVATDNDRITLNLQNTFSPVKNLSIRAEVYYTKSTINTDNTLPRVISSGYPYSKITDQKGNPISMAEGVSASYIDEVAGKGFLDWKFYPLEELRSDANRSKSDLNNIRINSAVKYDFTKFLSAEVSYQYEKGTTKQTSLDPVGSSDARIQINKFAKVDTEGKVIGYNIPIGGILSTGRNELSSYNIRGQLNFNHSWAKHNVNAIAAIEQREVTGESFNEVRYGYDPETGNSVPVDLASMFPTNPIGSDKIPSGGAADGTIDRFRSYIMNAAYTFDDRYTLSVSGRADQSNFFGVKSNQRTVPLWSFGAMWRIDRETFYNLTWLPYLKLRATYGFNGNLDKNITAITTFYYSPLPAMLTNAQYANINTIGNQELRWEKTGMLNLGFDFAAKNDIVAGSIEYFRRKGVDLIGDAEMPPSSGITIFRGNFAKMRNTGVDIKLNTRNITGTFSWNTSFLFSWAADKVLEYTGTSSPSLLLSEGLNVFPWAGQPVYGMYSLKWGGLDPQTGDPLGVDASGKKTKDYATLMTPKSFGDLVYNGPARPVYSGGLLNTFSYKRLTLSFNLTFKAGYYFRKSSLSYTDLFNSDRGHVDYGKRWQKPGDEQHTQVPSLVYPIEDPNRDPFYAASEINVAKGDHIRLQDISLSYDLDKNIFRKLPVSNIRLYAYVNNIGILWRANKDGLDPDFPTDRFPIARSYAFGLKVDF